MILIAFFSIVERTKVNSLHFGGFERTIQFYYMTTDHG